MAENNDNNNFSERVDVEAEGFGEKKDVKSDNPFLHPDHAEASEKPKEEAAVSAVEKKVEEVKKKKSISVGAVVAVVFIVIIAFVVLMIFVLAMGGPTNPILNTFKIDPLFLKESLIQLTNISFGGIGFVLFLLFIIGLFRGVMLKKEEAQKKKGAFIFAASSFGLIFLNVMIWLGLLSFISKFVVNAQPPEAKILYAPSQAEILKMESPIEVTLSAQDVLTAWTRKRQEVVGYAWDLDNDGSFEFKTNEVEFDQEFNYSGPMTIQLLVDLADGSQDIIKEEIVFPSAVFKYEPKSGPAPLAVAFDASIFDDTQNPIIEYAWDFDGDGEMDLANDESESTYTFDRIGVYNVVLRTKTITGSIKRYSVQVEVQEGFEELKVLTPKIEANPGFEGVVPFKVEFNAEKSKSLNERIISYVWDFGDNSDNQEGLNVEHVFEEVGTYDVVLTIESEGGVSESETMQIEVLEKRFAPTAVIVTNPEVLEGDTPFTVEFSGTSSVDPDSDIISYEWFLDAAEDAVFSGTKFSHIFREEGVFDVKLVVKDADGNEGEGSVSVSTTGLRLKAQIDVGGDKVAGSVPLTLDFDASSSVYTDGKIVSYEWDFDDDTGMQLAGAKVSHRFDRVGEYEVKVRILTDDGQEAEDVVKIYARTPTLQSCFSVSRHSGAAPLDVSFDSKCSEGNIVTWKWDFGDGSVSTDRRPVHTFEVKGEFEVWLEVIDETKNVSRYKDTITVN